MTNPSDPTKPYVKHGSKWMRTSDRRVVRVLVVVENWVVCRIKGAAPHLVYIDDFINNHNPAIPRPTASKG